MAITTRDFTLSSTGSVSNLSGSSIGMPEGMTSSISSDGTTFLLNGDDSQVSATAAGTLTMFANGTDEKDNERSASASIQGEILPAYYTVDYELNDVYNHLAELQPGNFFVDKFVFSENFSFNKMTTNIDKGLYAMKGFFGIQHYYLEGDNYDTVEIDGNYTGIIYKTLYNGFQPSFSNDDGNGDLDNKTGNRNRNIAPHIVSSVSGNNTNFDKNGTLTITFGIFISPSSFALKMN